MNISRMQIIGNEIRKKGIIIPAKACFIASNNINKCFFCGDNIMKGISIESWFGDTFTSFNAAAEKKSNIMCENCCLTFSHNIHIKGYEKPQRLMSFCHIITADEGWQLFTKKKEHKIKMIELLTEKTKGWIISAITYTGQHHTLFLAPYYYRCSDIVTGKQIGRAHV